MKYIQVTERLQELDKQYNITEKEIERLKNKLGRIERKQDILAHEYAQANMVYPIGSAFRWADGRIGKVIDASTYAFKIHKTKESKALASIHYDIKFPYRKEPFKYSGEEISRWLKAKIIRKATPEEIPIRTTHKIVKLVALDDATYLAITSETKGFKFKSRPRQDLEDETSVESPATLQYDSRRNGRADNDWKYITKSVSTYFGDLELIADEAIILGALM